MTQRNKQASKTDISLFCSEQSFVFNRLNVNMLFLFVCLSDCKYLLFVAFQILWAGVFLSASLFYRGKVELCHPLYDFRGKESKLFFADVAYCEN